jgi:hypothetical protein
MADNGSFQEAYVHGVSTRAVDDLVRAMGGEEDQMTVRGTVGAVDGPISGSTPPTSGCARTAGSSAVP